MKFKRLKDGLIVQKTIILINISKKKIELINWVLENMKDPSINICALIESRTNNIIDKINEKAFYP